jgi:hypothetical protein
MRRMLTLGLVLALAGPALAAPGGPARGRMVVPAQPAAPRLRGALTPDAGPAVRSQLASGDSGASLAERLFLPPPTAASAPPSGAPQACRLTCAQTYYFCAAGEDAESCPSRWALCRSGCDAPSPVQSFAPR